MGRVSGTKTPQKVLRLSEKKWTRVRPCRHMLDVAVASGRGNAPAPLCRGAGCTH